MTRPELIATWELQRRWSIAANQLKASYGGWHRAALGLVVAAAVAETFAGQFAEGYFGPGMAGVGAFCVGLVPIVGRWKLGTGALRTWVAARSVSEALKTEIYQCLIGCGDYAGGDAEATLVRKREEVLRGTEPSLIEGVPPDDKALHDIHDITGYLASRVDDQIAYYESAKAREQRVVDRGRTIQTGLAGIGFVLGAWAALGNTGTFAPWVPMLTTIAASFAAHIAFGRHEHMVITYEATANRLRALRGDWGAGRLQDECTLVLSCEAAISTQNEGWMARFMSEN